MARRRNSFDAYEEDDNYVEPARKSRRVQSSHSNESDEPVSSDDSDETGPQNRSVTSSNASVKQQRIQKLTKAFVRSLLSIESKYQVLNKGLIAKIMEVEGEKGHGIQFKKDLLPNIRETLERVFGMGLVEFPPRQDTKNASSDDYMLVSKLPLPLKDEIYTYFQTQSRPIASLSDLKEPSSSSSALYKMGANLPKPVSDLIAQGFKMLIIAIILLNENNVNKQDLLNILQTKFQLNFSETKPVELLGTTIPDFLLLMVKQEYLNQLDVTQTNSKTQRRITSASRSSDDNMIIYSIGRRTMAELDQDSFIDFLKKIYPNWNEELERNAVYTLNDIWKASHEQ
ncbi:hypothetical protein KL933_004358 [Ogataea haglerorum]|uniref:MAGE domain-containing protein n=1 Tax=Ogataea haglerorum TaxID=1937702 RepID=A0AAN6HZC0_9ASCO|nr:hypothetical protein KL950_004791 [Ogataea haglerorum]KAG7703873.1 hypothetical protein KL914_004364 [Ogataea haglerorum]KAG7715493.1 hypothetical protein KL913_003828 [Ogataea haglerorum]KAG7716015.1 hypothetical protein KL949_003910 [Ogataea haglerorum]KAG7725344.1 hypothetical protein KL933_004358 [Ogataea haglerorum]